MQQVSETLGECIPDAFDGDAHAFLVACYKHPKLPLGVRIHAASAALRVEKPALSSGTLEFSTLAQRLDAAIARSGLVIDVMPLEHNGNATLEVAENRESAAGQASDTAQDAANNLNFAA